MLLLNVTLKRAYQDMQRMVGKKEIRNRSEFFYSILLVRSIPTQYASGVIIIEMITFAKKKKNMNKL